MSSRSEESVQIAQDVINQIKAGFLLPESGIWLKFDLAVPADSCAYTVNVDESASIKACVDTGLIKECRVCAMGSMFMAYIRRHNEVTLEEKEAEWDEISDKLESYFSNSDLVAIETIFEGGFGGTLTAYGNDDGEVYLEASDRDEWGISVVQGRLILNILKHRAKLNEKDCLIKMMQNLVNHNGKLNLPALLKTFKAARSSVK
jgi:hypothetical protein